jgi:hypothetical protein
VNYTANDNDTRIVRYKVDINDVNLADPNSDLELLNIGQPFSNHNAGDLNFGPDGYLYISMGDGGSGGDPGNRAQSKTTFLGKTLRIDVSGATPGGPYYTIPADNPFVGDTTWQDEVWAIGLRNPWRFSFDRLTHDIWYGDVGQNDFEEISVQYAGQGGINFGWRCYEANDPYNLSNCSPASEFVFPVFNYVNTTAIGRSVTGGFVYRGSQYPDMYGYYILGDYESGNVWTILADSAAGYPSDYQPQPVYRAFSTFGEGEDGEIYAADHKQGIIYRVVDACQNLSPEMGVNATNDSLFTEPGASYQWFYNNNPISGATKNYLVPGLSGTYNVTITYPNGCVLDAGPLDFAVTNIGDLFHSEHIQVFPNPFTDKLQVTFEGAASPDFGLNLYSLDGKMVVSATGKTADGYVLDRGNMAIGIYVLEIVIGEDVLRGKVVVE